MAYQIFLTQKIANIIGTKNPIVNNLTVNDGYISVNNYHVPLSNILLIKEINE